MCGLLTEKTPTAERSALNRSIRTLARDGLLEISHEFPYDLLWIARPGAYGDTQRSPLNLAVLDPRPVLPGQQLWFRKPGLPKLFTPELVEDMGAELEGVLPDGDATWSMVMEFSFGDGYFAEFSGGRDPHQALNSEDGQFARWYLYGPTPKTPRPRKQRPTDAR
ncbi:hypothetical protein DFR67_11612 [Williamsia limnetica]|uniref:Uncharacterized protein n=1 Tax=Williamsia limnetica TaxID=882452 RepID=A0A318RIM3_WILLI|nr:hypothetical protein DFR67_11612 [Williamsia limnetica]